MTEPTLDESIQEIFPTLPLPIQKFLREGKLGETARLIMERYGLHIDQGAILENNLMLALFGLEGPDEFAAELYKQLPISEQTVKDILSDVNQQVFAPIRDEMRKGGIATATRPAEVTKPPAPSTAPGGSAPVPSGTPPRYFHLENKLPNHPGQSALRPPVLSTAPIPPGQRAPITYPRALQTSFNPARRLEDHEEPHIEFGKAPASLNLPGALPSQVVPAAAPQAPKTQVPVSPAPKPSAPVAYSADPYREPIEEHEK